MLRFARFACSAALLASLASARPMAQDSGIGELAVSAPNGIPLSDVPSTAAAATATLATTTATDTLVTTTASLASTTSDVPSQVLVASDARVTETPKYGAPAYSPPKQVYEPPKNSYEPPKKDHKYGSGKQNWGGKGYDDCVQQCLVKFGQPPSLYKPTATAGHLGAVGSGPTHTIIVAPSQGVLRYVPFALNASVGDTVLFRWGANNHTVTQGSVLQLCNRTSDVDSFTSGRQDKDFEFTQVINNTDTTYFFCNTPTHCQKGMFGALNAPVSFGSATSVSLAAQDLASRIPELAALWSKTDKDTQGNERAANWGGSLDMKNVPEWAQASYIENVMYTRSFLAANPEVMKDDGSIDFSDAANTPLKFPQDISLNLQAAPPSTSAAPVPVAPTGTDATPSAAPTLAGALTGGAGSLSSPTLLVAVMAVFVSFLAL